MTLRIGFLLFPGVQQLDLTGPYDVLASVPGAEVRLVWKSLAPVRTSSAMLLTPDTTFDDCPPLDVLCIPGGSGVSALMQDAQTLAFVRAQARFARYVTSVCTGALVLGAAGLLQGRRATTHWALHELLAPLGATPVRERVVRDGNLITGGGITAGIDFALTLVAEMLGETVAQTVQLELEYAPAPPFNAGDPASAPAAVVASVREREAAGLAARSRIVEEIAATLR